MTVVCINRTGTEVVMYCIVYVGLVQGQYCVISIGLVLSCQEDWYWGNSGMYHIRRTSTGAVSYQ